MSTLNYLPLYASVYVLQLVVLVTVAWGRLPGYWRLPFLLGWGVALGVALLIGYRTRRWSAGASQWYQLLPLPVMVGTVALWIMAVGPRFFYVVVALGLLVGRNAMLATRRALYLDLAIAMALFYDTIGVQKTLQLGSFGIAFLIALVFVLMADYSDRRLGYVRADDAEAREALAPSVRNALLATLLVLALGALIYALLPQPAARNLGIPDPDAPYRADFGNDGGADGKKVPAREDPDGRKQPAGGDGKGEVAKGEGKGEGEGKGGGGTPKAGPGPQAKLDTTRGGDARAKPEPRGGRGKGEPDPSRPGDIPDPRGQPTKKGAPGDDEGKGEEKKAGGDDGKQGEDEKKEGKKGEDRKSDNEEGKKSGEKSEEKKEGEKKDSKDGKKEDKKDEKKEEKKEEKNEEKKDEKKPPPPQPLVLATVDAAHPLYVRTHAYVLPVRGGWVESQMPPQAMAGAGRFVFDPSDSRDGFLQHYRIQGTLPGRILISFRPAQLAFPAQRIGRTADEILLAGGRLDPGVRYTVLSTLQYIGQRPTGSVQPSPPDDPYRSIADAVTPRVRQLAASLVRGKGNASERAAALEAHLRSGFAYGRFDAGAADPAEAFLFEQRRGDSAQFASALALMLRAEGIAARVAGGFRARRLNPLHGDYELWEADRHHWVEAFVDERWTAYEPSPWMSLPAREVRESTWELAQAYVRMAKTNDAGEAVLPPQRPSDAYLWRVLAWGWTVTYGPWLLLALVLALLVAWRQQRWLRPLFDALDLMLLKRGAEPRARVLSGYRVVERVFMRRGLRRGGAENHAEYLGRMAVQRPHLGVALAAVGRKYAQARYGAETVSAASADEALLACREIADLVDERPRAA